MLTSHSRTIVSVAQRYFVISRKSKFPNGFPDRKRTCTCRAVRNNKRKFRSLFAWNNRTGSTCELSRFPVCFQEEASPSAIRRISKIQGTFPPSRTIIARGDKSVSLFPPLLPRGTAPSRGCTFRSRVGEIAIDDTQDRFWPASVAENRFRGLSGHVFGPSPSSSFDSSLRAVLVDRARLRGRMLRKIMIPSMRVPGNRVFEDRRLRGTSEGRSISRSNELEQSKASGKLR